MSEAVMERVGAAVAVDSDELVIAGRRFRSRLIVGTGKYKDGAETKAAIEASGAEMVTVAVRRRVLLAFRKLPAFTFC